MQHWEPSEPSPVCAPSRPKQATCHAAVRVLHKFLPLARTSICPASGASPSRSFATAGPRGARRARPSSYGSASHAPATPASCRWRMTPKLRGRGLHANVGMLMTNGFPPACAHRRSPPGATRCGGIGEGAGGGAQAGPGAPQHSIPLTCHRQGLPKQRPPWCNTAPSLAPRQALRSAACAVRYGRRMRHGRGEQAASMPEGNVSCRQQHSSTQ